MKESKEVLLALLELLPIIVADFKDGLQASDLVDIYSKVTTNEELKAKLQAAYDGYAMIPEEIKEAKAADYITLVVEVLPEILKTLEAIKK